ncbi:hypothetical protein JCM10908_005142 [Rhodotorula pacifica]|uniref:Cac2p n=1 Tax=Rhodotorula pacifica TaxID=1495444 RepID=UPI00317D742C
MKAKVIEIRWNDKQPIYSTDFHSLAPTQHIAKHPYTHQGGKEAYDTTRDKAWRLATCGGDNKIRLWLVHPRPAPSTSQHAATAATLLAAVAGARSLSASAASPSSSSAPAAAAASTPTSTSNANANAPPPDPRVEYLATLSQHQGVVNCVRFSPNGDALASAGDDGNILIWVPGEGTKSFGETATEDLAFEKESWRVKGMIRSLSGKEIYDLAWSPCGTRILAGSVDHTATIYDVASCSPLYRLAEHTNYVQGVAWDPRGGYIATQSSDRTMHVYEVRDGTNGVEVHPVGKNSRMEVVVGAGASGGSTASSRRPREASSSSSSQHHHKLPRLSGPSASTSSSAVAATATSPNPSSSTATAFRPPMHPRTQSTRSDTSDRSSEASSSVSLSQAPSATSAATSVFAKGSGASREEAATGNHSAEMGKEREEQEEVTTAMDPPQGIPHHPPAPSPSPSAAAAQPSGSTSHHARSASGSHSRRSSTSRSQSSQSPRLTPRVGATPAGRPLRSPSPAPLPAVMPPLSPKISPAIAPAWPTDSNASGSAAVATGAQSGGVGLGLGASAGADHAAAAAARVETVKLYSDANSTHFFRRLAWSPDGALLLTPAGLWEDPYAAASLQASHAQAAPFSSAHKAPHAASSTSATEPKPTVYIYSRSNIARPPIAHLPGHRTTSLGIRFCPVLWQLRDPSSSTTAGSKRRRREGGGGGAVSESEMDVEQEGVDEEEEENAVSVQLSAEGVDLPLSTSTVSEKGKERASTAGQVGDALGGNEGEAKAPAKSPARRPPRSLFDLPYRMVYAVATLDSVYLYDTQQAGPLAMFGNLHYAPFTDLTWSPDGQTLVVSSQDGYCSVIAFEPGELGTPFEDDGTLAFPLPHLSTACTTSSAVPTRAPAVPTSAETATPTPTSLVSASTGTGAAQAAVTPEVPQVGEKRGADSIGAGVVAAGSGGSAGALAESGEPAPKKVKKRVAPTLVKPLS